MSDMQKIGFIGKVISEGRVTIPKEIRDLLGIHNGDFVELEVKDIKKSQEAR